MPKFNAAKSLYNTTDAETDRGKALAGNVGGQDREQTVLTPDWLVTLVRTAFGGTIDLDPCAADDESTHIASVNITKQYDGLSIPWTGCKTYSNPPYADLKAWMAKYWAEALHGVQTIALIPFRPQRRWFSQFTDGYDVLSLHPFPFKGHKQAFPAPLCLVTYNIELTPELLGTRVTACWRVK